MSSNPYINNIYKRWKDIKEYVDTRIQFRSLIDRKEIKALLDEKQDKLIAGENITIEDNVISAIIPEVDLSHIEEQINNLNTEVDKKQDKLIAGENITIEDNVISVDLSPIEEQINNLNTEVDKKQDKLIAGENIAIEDNVISVIIPEVDLITKPQIEALFVNNVVIFIAEEDNSSIGLERLSTNQTLEYSTDTTTWNSFDTTTNISLNNGDKVYIRGILSSDIEGEENNTQFKMSGKIAASGNCNAIWNYQDLTAPLKTGCGFYMFRSCTSLVEAPELPATELAYECYFYMFEGCTSLTKAPELPATVLADRCYMSMFRRCTNLNYIKCLATDKSAYHCTYKWVDGVSSTGTFIKHPDATWETGVNGIPENWTVEDYAE